MIEFEIPGLPKMPNELLGSHWRIRSSNASKWFGLVMVAVNPFKRTKISSPARLTLIRYSAVEPDHDGLVGSFKAVIDGLVKCGVIPDDSPDHIKAEYLWEKCPPKKGKIKVRIEEPK